jgi:hypothetical protein
MSSKKTTKTKQLVVGKQQYINSETGLVEDFNVIKTEDTDFNFQKIWLAHLLEALDIVGNRKIKVLNWMLENKNSENQILGTQREIAQSVSVSVPVVNETIKMLMSVKALKKVRNGVYVLNPDIMFKGYNQKRMNLLLQYEKIKIHDQKKELASMDEKEDQNG